jgi:hypothetical protein
MRMISKQCIKNKETTWLLHVTLFVSLFISSGCTTINQPQHQATKIELVTFGDTLRKRIVSYSWVLTLRYKNKVIFEFGRREINHALHHHAAFIKTTLDNALNELLSFEKPNTFVKIKHAPHSPDEDLHSMRG